MDVSPLIICGELRKVCGKALITNDFSDDAVANSTVTGKRSCQCNLLSARRCLLESLRLPKMKVTINSDVDIEGSSYDRSEKTNSRVDNHDQRRHSDLLQGLG